MSLMHFDEEQIRKVFRAMDKSQHGGVTAKQLCVVMKKMGTPTSESEARDIVQAADKRGTGMITEDDFVSFMRERAMEFTRQLREAFQAMDTDKSGFLTPSQLRSGLAKQGMTFSNKEFKDMLDVVDVDKSGGISWEEFLSAMQ
ncbi:hypothetical protein BOX15_Mlig017612g1 [Macrostomum lignano]|uniref:EF-hand domain-containing protein n=1 Tax=Macrostomum lignano TaxID=282301 RepID=A0A267EGQ6_9PLAT|nr:hypothetical protein BOX15_Mlig017612g2 [Macrostomum lignano]PAA90824.1 hypothetical protein BOX15_Mlig017612g1 [Macrostomum lignano]